MGYFSSGLSFKGCKDVVHGLWSITRTLYIMILRYSRACSISINDINQAMLISDKIEAEIIVAEVSLAIIER